MDEGQTKYEETNKLKEGRFIVHEGEAYRITSLAHSKSGKHGHAKVRLEAASVIGNRKVSIIAGEKMPVPIIDKRSAQVLTTRDEVEQRGMETINKKIANVMDSETYETFDMEVPQDLIDSVKENSEVIYWIVMGHRVMQQKKKTD